MSTLAKQLRSEGRDIIDLSAGEPDFDTPAWISEAAVAGIRAGGTRYTPAAGLPELRRAIAADLSRQAGRDLPWEGVVVSNGAKHSLFNACFALFGPGDEVMIATPYWTSYPEIVTLARSEPLFVRGAQESGFSLTPEDLEMALTRRTRGLILCTPSNPTGFTYSPDDLRTIAEWARDRGIWLINDEIYRHIHFSEGEEGGGGRAATGLLDLPEESLGRFVLVDGVSKSFAMTGWRIGFSYCDPEVARRFSALQSHVTSNPATPSQIAALEVYTDASRAEDTRARMADAFRARRDLVTRLMKEELPQVDFIAPHGAFYLFFRVDALFPEGVADSQSFCAWLLEKTGVATVPGEAFGDGRYARLSFATSSALLTEAIGRMAKALNARGSAEGS